MKYRTAAAIAMCLTNGAIAAPTQSNQQGVATHKSPYGRPPQVAKDTLERRDRDVNTAELSEMIHNTLAGVSRQSLRKRGDIGEGAAKALAQTSRFTQKDGQEENGLDLKINLGGLTNSLRDQARKRSVERMPKFPKKLPVPSRRDLDEDSSSPDGSGNTIKELVDGAGLNGVLTKSGLESITNGANLQEVTDVTGLTSKTGAGSLGEQATEVKKLKTRQAKAEAEKPKTEADKPEGKDQKPSKEEKKKLLKDLLTKLGLINATGKLNLDKTVNTLGVSKLTGKLNVDKLTDSLGATELTNNLGVTGGKDKGKAAPAADGAKAPTADKTKFTVIARSFPVNQKQPAAE